MSPLSYTNRYHLITWFFINGMDPRMAVEWCGFMGLLVGSRKTELERIIGDLNNLTRTRDPKLANWHGYCMETHEMVDLLHYRVSIKKRKGSTVFAFYFHKQTYVIMRYVLGYINSSR
jgi:hypothetical protein